MVNKMTQDDKNHCMKVVLELCKMLCVMHPVNIYESKKELNYIDKTISTRDIILYRPKLKCKHRKIRAKLIKKHKNDVDVNYDLYLTKDILASLLEIDKFDLGNAIDRKATFLTIIHELTHVKYNISNHSRKFFKYMNKLTALFVYKEYGNTSYRKILHALYNAKALSEILYTASNKKIKKLRKSKPISYYSRPTYNSVVLGRLCYHEQIQEIKLTNRRLSKYGKFN